MSHSDTPREICRGFRNNNGRCRFGDDCKFEHSEGDLIPPPARVASRGECFDFRDSGSCQHGNDCRFSHGEDDPRFDENGLRDVSNEVCRNFQRGKCAFGDDCRRLHVEREEPNGRQQARAEGASSKKKTRRRERKPQEKLDEQCNKYLQGRCRFGDTCRRQHIGEVTVEKIDEQCNNYLVGRCRAGDLCRRQHTGTPNVKKLDEPCNNFAAGKCTRGDSCRRQHVIGEADDVAA